MQVRFRPIQWTGPTTPAINRRSRSTFKAGWQNTLTLLERELDHLRALDVIIEADFGEQDIRIDGWPRGNARQPVFPGVRVAFGSKHGPLIYGTDTCDYWQHNLRSIALGLEALRAVDRYGITARAEQYTGFRAIGSGLPMPATAEPEMTRERAIVELRRLAGWDFDPSDAPDQVLKLGYRAAARLHHPDAGGDPAAWIRLQQAARVLGIQQ